MSSQSFISLQCHCTGEINSGSSENNQNHQYNYRMYCMIGNVPTRCALFFFCFFYTCTYSEIYHSRKLCITSFLVHSDSSYTHI